MILSVVIVSYNVKFFLEQCLSSLQKAVEGSTLLREQAEVFIIDNASKDGSLDFLAPLFPGFHFIQQKGNTGFAKANNEALRRCTGSFILFLNPDTILAEDTLDICLSFFRDTADAGALGVHMVDGRGNYLKESKRGFPSPRASFFKMAGLTTLVPRSKFISGYYMGHLRENVPHAVDILSGAFMMVRKDILDKTGGFDEQFFMYAEDIDLSYRITRNGYRNYYLPSTGIIHFKGESTRKDIRYVKMFYTAMKQFIKKHYPGSGSSLQLFFLQSGVRLHQFLAFLRLPFKKSVAPRRNPLRIYIKGEPEMQRFWKQILGAKNIPLSDSENEGEEILFCEGPDQTWKTIITEIENNKKQRSFKFYGHGTHAAVGSNSSREPGEVIEI